jgi:hypothetical protein
MTTVTPKRMAMTQTADTNYVTIYTVAAGKTAIIRTIDIVPNSSCSVYFHIVPQGSSPINANSLFFNKAIASATTLQYRGYIVMNANDTLQFKSTTTLCGIQVHGVEIT